MVHHLRKANYLLTGEYKLPSVDEYLDWNLADIYDIQIAFLLARKPVSVLNTCIFMPIDFAPKRFFEMVSRRKDVYDI